MADEINLVDVDTSTIYSDVLVNLEQGISEALYPGDERRIFGEALVAVLATYLAKANDASRQTFLRYARGKVLDALGERLGVERIAAIPATTVLKFTLSAAQAGAITIPAMTRVTTDGTIYFRTTAACVINAGQLTGTAPAECETAGEVGNGILVGDVATLVDLQPYVKAVQNMTVTTGGDDGEPYTTDGDDRYRERIKLAPNRLSTAGPEQAYRYHAMSANADIVDVAVFSETYTDTKTCTPVSEHVYIGGDLLEPDELLTVNGKTTDFTFVYADSLLEITLTGSLASQSAVTVAVQRRMDGRVKVVPLMEGGRQPDDDVVEQVEQAVNDRTVRPMTDVVTVEKPTYVDYTIQLTYTTTVEDEATVVQAVEGAGGAIERYKSEQCEVLGRAINPDVLKTYVMQAGALRCDVTQPVHTAVGTTQVAHWNGTTKATHTVERTAGWS